MAAPNASDPTQPRMLNLLDSDGPSRRTGVLMRLVYAGLGGLLVAAVIGLVFVARQATPPPRAAWSSWKPARGDTARVTSEIATHIAAQYRGTTGGQLLAILPGTPEVTRDTKVTPVSKIAILTSPTSQTIRSVSDGKDAVQAQLCGLGVACSLVGGKATLTRDRLVRREALELALYTFKFVPSAKDVIAYMPPPPGKVASTLLFLDRQSLAPELSVPLAKTLRPGTPPLPTDADLGEQKVIDDLTLGSEYEFSYEALPDGTQALILAPDTT